MYKGLRGHRLDIETYEDACCIDKEELNKAPTPFEKDLNLLKQKFQDVDIVVLACYLCNFEDEYVCKKHNGGCNYYNFCKEIDKGVNYV